MMVFFKCQSWSKETRIENMLEIADGMQTSSNWLRSFYYPMAKIYKNETSQLVEIKSLPAVKKSIV